jgi:hypothetical protein
MAKKSGSFQTFIGIRQMKCFVSYVVQRGSGSDNKKSRKRTRERIIKIMVYAVE